MHNVNNNQV